MEQRPRAPWWSRRRATSTSALLEAVGDWRAFLASGLRERDADDLRLHERTGRPLGDPGFLAELELKLGRRLRPGKRGRKKAESTVTRVN